MLRFIGVAWLPSSAPHRAAAMAIGRRLRESSQEWVTATSAAGLHVYCKGVRVDTPAPIELHNGSGIILGTLFKRGADPGANRVSTKLAERDSEEILRTRGRVLVERYWGRYVAFARNVSEDITWVLRDPTGRIPCQMVECEHAVIFCSCLEDIAALGLTRFSINWPYISARLISSFVECRATGLSQVENVIAGERVEVSQSGLTRRVLWHPSTFVDAKPLLEPAEAASALHDDVVHCVRSWAQGQGSILARLSGGLDSSIVLGCLQEMTERPPITCLNYYSPDYDGDERSFARLAAARADCTLIERRRNDQIGLEEMLSGSRTAQPTNYPLRIELDGEEADLIHRTHASAIFDGNGGDGLFYQYPITETASDFVHINGLSPQLLGVAIQLARASNLSVWHVLATALRDGMFRSRRWDPRAESFGYSSLIRPEVMDSVRHGATYLHPWFDSLVKVPHGKLWHTYNASIPLNFEDPDAPPSYPTEVYPIFSQPIIELCLRIPTFVMAMDGWDRALARKAFTSEVPREILFRRSKGGREDHVKAIFAHNIEFARELLLGGVLVSRELLKEDVLKRSLDSGVVAQGPGIMEMFNLLSIESWLRKWLTADAIAEHAPLSPGCLSVQA